MWQPSFNILHVFFLYSDKCNKAKERIVRIEKLPDIESKAGELEEEKENLQTAAGDTSITKNNLPVKTTVINPSNTAKTSSASRVKLINDSYYKPLNWDRKCDKKKDSNKVTFASEVDTNDISGNDSNASASDINLGEEQSDGPTKEGGRVRGRQRYNKVVQVKSASESDADQCKTQ